MIGEGSDRKSKFSFALYSVIPRFSGRCCNFFEFLESFITLVDITDVEPEKKFKYLWTKLDDSSVKEFSSYSERCYETLLVKFTERFTKPDYIMRDILKETEELPKCRWPRDLWVLEQYAVRLREIRDLFERLDFGQEIEQEMCRRFLILMPDWVTKNYCMETQGQGASLGLLWDNYEIVMNRFWKGLSQAREKSQREN